MDQSDQGKYPEPYYVLSNGQSSRLPDGIDLDNETPYEVSEPLMIGMLYRYGHAFNPEYPETHHLTKESLPSSLQDPLAKIMVRSYQDFLLPTLDVFTTIEHGRPAKADGNAGVATQDLLRVKRCGHPDYLDPKSNRANGPWPSPCVDHGKGIGVSTNFNTMPSNMSRERWDRIRDRVFGWYHEVGVPYYEVEYNHPTEQEHVRHSWRRGSGWIGLAQFPGGSCRDSLFNYLDNGYMSSSDANVAELFKHELGHNSLLYHVRQGTGTMSPVIVRGGFGPHWVPEDASWNVLKRLYPNRPSKPYTITDPPDPGPGPGPEPPTGVGIRFDAEGDIYVDGVNKGPHIITIRRKPQA